MQETSEESKQLVNRLIKYYTDKKKNLPPGYFSRPKEPHHRGPHWMFVRETTNHKKKLQLPHLNVSDAGYRLSSGIGYREDEQIIIHINRRTLETKPKILTIRIKARTSDEKPANFRNDGYYGPVMFERKIYLKDKNE